MTGMTGLGMNRARRAADIHHVGGSVPSGGPTHASNAQDGWAEHHPPPLYTVERRCYRVKSQANRTRTMSASNAQVTRERITDYKPFLSSSANRRRSITDITPSTSAFSAMATRIAHGTNTTRVTRSCGTKARPVSHSSTPSHQASSPFTSDHLICRRSSRGFDQRDSNSWIVRSGLARRLPRAVRHHRPRPGRLSPVRPAARVRRRVGRRSAPCES